MKSVRKSARGPRSGPKTAKRKPNRAGMRNATLYEKALALADSSKPEWGEVFRLLSRAQEAGDPRAAYALATWRLHGKEPYVKRDVKEAVRLLKIAADDGVPEALYDLAVCYQNGEGVRENDRKAFDLYLRAALKGEVDSVVEVARCLKYGRGVERNLLASRAFLDHAADMSAGTPVIRVGYPQ